MSKVRCMRSWFDLLPTSNAFLPSRQTLLTSDAGCSLPKSLLSGNCKLSLWNTHATTDTYANG
jgi:hypothetical protein